MKKKASSSNGETSKNFSIKSDPIKYWKALFETY